LWLDFLMPPLGGCVRDAHDDRCRFRVRVALKGQQAGSLAEPETLDTLDWHANRLIAPEPNQQMSISIRQTRVPHLHD
jgi:hypothetical protein